MKPMEAYRCALRVAGHKTNPAPHRVRRNPHPQTYTPAFKRWFGASKVVDAEGEPLVVYHGTRKGGFDAFMRRSSDAIFFTNDPEVAWSYACSHKSIEKDDLWKPDKIALRVAGIYAVYLRIENPLVVDAGGDRWNSILVSRLPKALQNLVYEVAYSTAKRLDFFGSDGVISTDGLAYAAERLGYDGTIIQNVDDEKGGRCRLDNRLSTVYAVFDPTQVKSANMNVGTFDPADPSILRNPRTRTRTRSRR